MKALLALLAMGLLGRALYISDGMLRPDALVLVLGSFFVVLVAACFRFPPQADHVAQRVLVPGIACVFALSLWGLSARLPGYYLSPGAASALGVFHAGLLAAGVIGASYLWRSMPVARV